MTPRIADDAAAIAARPKRLYRILRHDFGTLPAWRQRLHADVCFWAAWVLGATTYVTEREVSDDPHR